MAMALFKRWQKINGRVATCPQEISHEKPEKPMQVVNEVGTAEPDSSAVQFPIPKYATDKAKGIPDNNETQMTGQELRLFVAE